jgi:hypothetical protein
MIRKLFNGPLIGKFALGQLLVILALVGVHIWNRNTIANLRGWQEDVMVALSTAADARDKRGKPATLKPKYAVMQIRIFGEFRADVLAASAKARSAQSAQIKRIEAKVNADNQEKFNAYDAKIRDARSLADRLRADLMRAGTKPAANPIVGRAAGVPAIPDATRSPDAPASPDGLPDPDKWQPAMNLDERLLATEQALQLEALINSVRSLASIDPNESQNERALPQ